MLHSPAEICRQLLIDLKLCADPDVSNGNDWPVYTGQEPDGIGITDECVTVYDATWRADGRDMGAGETYWHYGVQIRLRARLQPAGWLKARAIQVALDQNVDMAKVIVNAGGPAAYIIQAVTGTAVMYIGQDVPKTKRHIHTMNPLLAIRDA